MFLYTSKCVRFYCLLRCEKRARDRTKCAQLRVDVSLAPDNELSEYLRLREKECFTPLEETLTCIQSARTEREKGSHTHAHHTFLTSYEHGADGEDLL